MKHRAEHKRQPLTFQEKLKLVREIEKNPKESKASVASRLNYPPTTVYTIWKQKEAILANAVQAGPSGVKKMRIRTGQFSNVETPLYEWFRQRRSGTDKIPISGDMLKEKAREIADSLKIENFKASTGWLAKFKKRHGIKGKVICGESGSVDEDTVNTWLEDTLPNIAENYSLDCIYNVDETALFYNLLPSKTLADKTDDCHDGKRSKERLTVLLGSNADGSDKLRPLVIGKSRSPRCFKNVRTLPTDYEANKKAWMTASLFESFVRKLDQRMRKKEKEILLLVDNCSAHPKDIRCTNVRIEFFPPNCTSRLQPMDLGVIAVLKAKYRKKIVKKALCAVEQRIAGGEADMKLNVLESMNLVSQSWREVTPDVIAKCFRKAGIAEDAAEFSDEDEDSDDERQPLSSIAEANSEEDQQLWNRVAQEMDFTTFVNIDKNVAVCGEQSIPEIISEGRHDSQSSDEEDADEPEPPPVPTSQEAAVAYDTLKRYLFSKVLDDTDVVTVLEVEKVLHNAQLKSTKQSAITDYFH